MTEKRRQPNMKNKKGEIETIRSCALLHCFNFIRTLQNVSAACLHGKRFYPDI